MTKTTISIEFDLSNPVDIILHSEISALLYNRQHLSPEDAVKRVLEGYGLNTEVQFNSAADVEVAGYQVFLKPEKAVPAIIAQKLVENLPDGIELLDIDDLASHIRHTESGEVLLLDGSVHVNWHREEDNTLHLRTNVSVDGDIVNMHEPAMTNDDIESAVLRGDDIEPEDDIDLD